MANHGLVRIGNPRHASCLRTRRATVRLPAQPSRSLSDMKIRLTAAEMCTAAGALMLVCACLFAVVMSRITGNLFFAMYSDATYPWPTRIFLAADKWAFIVPAAVGVPACAAWGKRRLDAYAIQLALVMHGASIAVLALVAIGIMLPLLTTTFSISAK